MIEIKKSFPFEIAQECSLFVPSNGLPDYMEIRNSAGKVFYFRHKPDGVETIKININKPGQYTANFDAFATVKPLEIFNPIKQLPTKERDFRTEIQIHGKKLDKTPALIYAKYGVVHYDRDKFAALPIPCKVFILLHEIGHFFYTTEWKADTFALYHFCKLGYNPSNAFYTLSKILEGKSEEQELRLKNLHNCILFQQTLI